MQNRNKSALVIANTFDTQTTPMATIARSAAICRVSVTALKRAIEQLGIKLHPTPAGKIKLLRPMDVRLLVEHFAARPR